MDVRLTDEQQMLQAMIGEVAVRLGALPVTLGAAMAPDGRRRAEAAAFAVLGAPG